MDLRLRTFLLRTKTGYWTCKVHVFAVIFGSVTHIPPFPLFFKNDFPLHSMGASVFPPLTFGPYFLPNVIKKHHIHISSQLRLRFEFYLLSRITMGRNIFIRGHLLVLTFKSASGRRGDDVYKSRIRSHLWKNDECAMWTEREIRRFYAKGLVPEGVGVR